MNHFTVERVDFLPENGGKVIGSVSIIRNQMFAFEERTYTVRKINAEGNLTHCERCRIDKAVAYANSLLEGKE